VTTEHFTLQGARSSTIAEATGRATMFLGTVSGGLVALGLIATAGGVHTAFYAFALILLTTLALVGVLTFNRVLQSGVEDLGYESRIARLRGYYFQYAPELVGYLLSAPRAQRLQVQGIGGGRWQRFFTAAAMVGLVTGVLDGEVGFERVDVLVTEHRCGEFDRLGIGVVQVFRRVPQDAAAIRRVVEARLRLLSAVALVLFGYGRDLGTDLGLRRGGGVGRCSNGHEITVGASLAGSPPYAFTE
jgi:hypothetical protein